MKQYTEDEATEKRCCGPKGATSFYWCVASECMGWLEGREIVRKIAGTGPPDKGEGWEKLGAENGGGGAITREQNWYRDVGRCGRVKG